MSMTPEERATAIYEDSLSQQFSLGKQLDIIEAHIRAAENDALERAARECMWFDADRIRALKHKDVL